MNVQKLELFSGSQCSHILSLSIKGGSKSGQEKNAVIHYLNLSWFRLDS